MNEVHSHRRYLGIDPGASGGIALIESDVVVPVPMPPTEKDVWDVLGVLLPNVSGSFAVIEKVGGFAGDRASGGNGPAMFKFGQSYGALRMALTAAFIPFEDATPQAWQRALGIPSRKKDETKVAFKNRLKARASQLFPGLKITLATADALLIAEYNRRKRTGTL